MKPILLIDVSSLMHPMIFTSGAIDSANGVPIEIVGQLFIRLLDYMIKFKSNNLVFVYDSAPYLRNELYKDYKKIRKEATQEVLERRKRLYTQINITKDILKQIGFLILEESGYEADDIIAHTCRNTHLDVIILSKDQDLYQCLSNNVCIYNYTNIYTTKRFKLEYNITPDLWAKVKSIAGCTTDCIKGVPGVGEVTALKYIKNELKTDSKQYLSIVNNPDIICETSKLVELPFKNGEYMTIRQDVLTTVGNASYNFDILTQAFEYYGVTYMGKDIMLKLQVAFNGCFNNAQQYYTRRGWLYE